MNKRAAGRRSGASAVSERHEKVFDKYNEIERIDQKRRARRSGALSKSESEVKYESISNGLRITSDQNHSVDLDTR